ncbi:MAG: FlgD immunoglobulin-like domain containing protein [Candidatus Eiseniibacteriota bacterium]
MSPQLRRSRIALALLSAGSVLLSPAPRADVPFSGRLNRILGGTNRPPICAGATPSQGTLWPPSHRLTAIAITGVTDPDGDPVTIRAIGITQDEPAARTDGGDECPDGLIDATGIPHVRLEREPGGNGRVYQIQFEASDGRGGTCRGAVSVCVPRARRALCADDGQTVNSLAPCPGGPGSSPLPIIDDCRCTGIVYTMNAGGGASPHPSTAHVTDTHDPSWAPRDTCPANARIDVEWHAEPPTVSGYAYRLDEPQFVEVDPTVTSVTYHSGVPPDTFPVTPGTKVFTLRAIDAALSPIDSTRYFRLNFRPDTWVAGPDPDVTGAPWVTKPNGEKYVLLVGGVPPPGGLPGTLMSRDSVEVLPVDRPERRTFLEIYDDTVFIRREFDTVHLGSWVAFHSGGLDSDSDYRVKVAEGLEGFPWFPGGVVLTPAGQNGSPIGFRSRLGTFLTPSGPFSLSPQSSLYPFFDPNSVFHFGRIAAYHPMIRSGRAYSAQRAEDGDGARDDRIALGDERRLVEAPANPYEQSLRPKVMVFSVNFPPELNTSDPGFRPKVAAPDTFFSPVWDLRLPASDQDPYAVGAPVGGPSPGTMRLRFKVTGADLDGNPLVFLDPGPGEVQQKYVNVTNVDLVVPATLASGPATLSVELCDCAFCEVQPGAGRCITRDIAVHYQAPALDPSAARSRATATPSGTRTPVATTTALDAPHLDPAGGNVTIRFHLATEGVADLALYDVSGHQVRHLASGRLPAGEHARVWDGRDARGRQVAPGIYFVRLRTDHAALTRKVLMTP